MAKALADRLAEAFAEYLHQQARGDWGYGATKNSRNDELIDEKYRGIRPAAGYPACPDHTEKRTLFDLLDAEQADRHHADRKLRHVPGRQRQRPVLRPSPSRYFAVDRIARDQVEDYARRKGMTLAEIERWLSPNLGYDPG